MNQQNNQYEEAKSKMLESVKKGLVSMDFAKTIFPDIRESEDERIRKELIEYVKDQQSSFISAPDCRDKYEEEENNKYNSWLDWLEKQGESKPIGKPQLSKELYEHIRNTCACIDDALSSETLADINDYLSMAERSAQSAFDMIEKQGEKPQGKSIIEAWKDMRLEVYQQASGNRHEPNCSDENTKMFSLNDIDEIVEKIYEK